MSLPNGTVAMEVGECRACPRGGTLSTSSLMGINCGGCGHHFHIGLGEDSPLLTEGPVFCPRCEGACLPIDIKDGSEKPTNDGGPYDKDSR